MKLVYGMMISKKMSHQDNYVTLISIVQHPFNILKTVQEIDQTIYSLVLKFNQQKVR